MYVKPGWYSGNHWAFAHKCARCGKVEYRLYEEEDSKYGDGNIQSVRPPKGWESVGHNLFCQSCAESYKEWMKRVGSE